MPDTTSTDTFTIDDCGAAIYPGDFRWPGEDMLCAYVARDWHGGQWSDLYALGCGDFRPSTIVGALAELESVTDSPHAAVDDTTASALEDLRMWADGVCHLLD